MSNRTILQIPNKNIILQVCLFIFLSVFIQSCSKEKDIFNETPDKSKANSDNNNIIIQPKSKTLPKLLPKLASLLVVLPQDEKNKDDISDIKNAALMALHDINDNNLRILFSSDLEPFSNLNQSPRGLFEKWPVRTAKDLLAIIGPLGSTAGKHFLSRKPQGLFNFALTNDSSLGNSQSYVVGLTPEHQAYFVATKVNFLKFQPQIEFSEMLTKLGYGFFAKTNSKSINEIETEELLPILVIGRPDELFFKRYINAVNRLLKDTFQQDLDILTVQEYIDQPNLRTDSADIVVQDIGNDPEKWSEIIQNSLQYNQRKNVFENRLEFEKEGPIFDILSKQEILEPAKYSAVIVIIHEKTEIRWIASLLEFYNNSWQKLKIIGMNSWQNYKSLLRESSLNNAVIPILSINNSLDKKLNVRYKSLFGKAPSYITKQVYDTIWLVYRNSRVGFLDLNVKIHGILNPGWSSDYRVDIRGYLVPELEMAVINSGKLVKNILDK